VDGLTPDCRTALGCLIPALPVEGKRVLEIRGLLNRLHNVIDAGTICRICDVDLIDLQLLAIVEEELKEGTAHGEGH
jgi:hypothetical protein